MFTAAGSSTVEVWPAVGTSTPDGAREGGLRLAARWWAINLLAFACTSQTASCSSPHFRDCREFSTEDGARADQSETEERRALAAIIHCSAVTYSVPSSSKRQDHH